MKARTIALLAGAGAPLIQAGPATAGFTGIQTLSKPNPFGLLVVNVYATFDRPGEDAFVAVGTDPSQPIVVEVIGGTFFQHPFGTDRPPEDPFGEFPSLYYDTFVTIGVKALAPCCQDQDDMVLSPDWPGFGESTLLVTGGGWAVTPDAPQGDPFNPDFAAGDGRVLIGQYATLDGAGFRGEMVIQFVSNGTTMLQDVAFEHFIPAPGAAALLGLAALGAAQRGRAA